jgi:hypothetical protein
MTLRKNGESVDACRKRRPNADDADVNREKKPIDAQRLAE